MANVQYPRLLPKPLQEGYALERYDPVRRTKMVSGRIRSRRMCESAPEYVQVSFLFTEAEAGFFEAWYDKKIDAGTARFDIEIQATEGIAFREARFTEMYKGPTLVGPNYWKVTAKLELKPAKRLADEWLDFPEYWLQANVIDVAMNREWPAA